MNIFRLSRQVFHSRESILNWCREKNLLPHPDTVICPLCGCQAVFEDKDGYVAGRFRCRKRIQRHVDPKRKSTRVDFELSGAKNSFFGGTKMGIPKVLVLTYCWVHEFNYRQTTDICHSILENEEARLSSETIADWFSYLREVSAFILEKIYNNSGQIGGPGRIVQLDEKKFGKRKNNRGKRVEGSWILGMIEIDAEETNYEGEFRLEICPDNKRDAETLIPLIQKHIAPGTTIYSDCWKAYNGLEELGYKHCTVNHSMHYKDPETGVHTNNIEASWRPLKRYLHSTQKKDLADNMCEYLWRREIRKKSQDYFSTVIENIAACDWSEFSEEI